MQGPRRFDLTGSCVALGALHPSPSPVELPRNDEFTGLVVPPSPKDRGAAKLEEGELLVKPASAKAFAAT